MHALLLTSLLGRALWFGSVDVCGEKREEGCVVRRGVLRLLFDVCEKRKSKTCLLYINGLTKNMPLINDAKPDF
jgi:hypothetical protein